MAVVNQVDEFRGLSGKRVLVTGAGRGMGRIIADGFVKNGCRVHVCDMETARLNAFRKDHPGTTSSVTDISDPSQVDGLFRDIQASLGGLDIVMNSTGIGGGEGVIEHISDEAWRRVMAVNVDGPFNILKRAVPMLKAAGGGSIVITSSTSGLMGDPNSSVYAASKFGVVGIVRSLAIELGGFGIRCNSVCPGPVYSTRQEETRQREAREEGITVRQARERYFMKYALSLSLPSVIDPEDIANMVLFLCSDSAVRVTGQSFSVDGDTQTLIEPPPASMLLKLDPDANIPQNRGGYMEKAKARFHSRFED